MNAPALEVSRQTLLVLLPEVLILLVATVMMTAGAFVRWPRRAWSLTAGWTLVVALVVLLVLWGRESGQPDATYPYAAVAVNDALAYVARLVFLLTGLILLGLAHDQVDDARAAEFFGALLMIQAGAMLVATANELVFLFAGLELVSLPTYLLLYLPQRTATTREAATKYFFLSLFSSGLMLFGLAYLYGLTGVSNLKALAYLVRAGGPQILTPATLPIGLVAVTFVMAGLGFRVAAVPFHFYAPDVYQGSPTILAALLAWVPKGIGFLAILRTLAAVVCVSSDRVDFAAKATVVAWVIAAATMTLGNTVALLQDNLKRLLAYSSIAHAGYLMIGVAVAFQHLDDPNRPGPFLGGEGIVFYLITYALMTLGAFGVILALSTPERTVETVDELDGLLWTRPLPATAMILCLFSLAGIPPLAGFWGKFWIFASAWTPQDETSSSAGLQLLAVIGVLNAAVGAYYYLRIVVKMVLAPAAGRLESRPGWPTAVAVGACAALSLGFGFYPRPIQRLARQAAVAAIAQPESPVIARAASSAAPR